MYRDIDIYPNSENPDDGMRIDYTDSMDRRFTAVFYEQPITPRVTNIHALSGAYMGTVTAENDHEYKLQVATIIDTH